MRAMPARSAAFLVEGRRGCGLDGCWPQSATVLELDGWTAFIGLQVLPGCGKRVKDPVGHPNHIAARQMVASRADTKSESVEEELVKDDRAQLAPFGHISMVA